MWTPKRVVLLTVGFCLFMAAYLVYAHFLGGIDGLPPLPEDYRPIARTETEPPPLPVTENSAKAKLRTAFGVDCKEIGYKVMLELPKRGMVLAAGDFKIDPEGKLLLFPFSLAIFGKGQPGAKDQEINTVQSDTALLTLDKPVNSIMEMSNRKIVGAELAGNIYLINNRRTPQRDDDISLFTQGPLYYQEQLQLVWTDKTVRLIDPQSKPHPTTVDGTQMYVYLTKENKPANPGQAAPHAPGKAETVSGVDRIELRKDVQMNLWLDAHSGFLHSGKDAADNKEKSPVAVDASKKTAPAESGKQVLPEEKVKVVIMTQGPFSYDLHTHLATFDISKISGPRPNVVAVHRINEAEGKLDDLQCDHLELQFRPGQQQAAKPPSENPGEGLELESARATGSEVILTSDAEVLEAHGNDFFYDKIKGLTTLKGTPRMWALKEGNEIRAPELQLLDQKGSQQATALGDGFILMLDKSTGKRTLEARWKQRFLYAKDGPLDVLTLVGDAAFIDQEHGQELQANTLKVWLEPKTPAPGARSDDQQNRKPHHLEAIGNIRSFGPDMHVHDADRLIIKFRDAEVQAHLPDAVPNKSDSAEDQPVKTDSADGQAVGKLTSRPTGVAAPKGEKPDPGTPGPPAQPGEPAKPRKPIDLQARSIVAHVVRTGEKNDLDKLWCEGAVHVHQDPASPDEKGVDIRGEQLALKHQVDGNILAVTGDNAQVQMDKIFILGPDINIDQTTNEVFVKGMGIMKLPSNAKLDGTKSDQTSELTVNWEKNMLFDGLTARFFGNIRAAQDNGGHLACQTMQVTLDRKISLREGNKTQPPAKMKYLLCDRDVWLEEATLDLKRITSFKRLDCGELAVESDSDTEESTAHATGPGRVRIFQLRQKDATASAAQTPGAAQPGKPALNASTFGPQTPGAAPRPGKPTPNPDLAGSPKKAGPSVKPDSQEEQFMLDQVTFQGAMIANNKTGIATFYDHVILIDVPTDDPDMKVPEDKPPKGSFRLSCEKLEVLRRKLENGTINQEMRAYRRVNLEGEEYSGHADVVKYDQSKELIILEGSEGNFAVLYKQTAKGREWDTIVGKRIMYWRLTGQSRVDYGRSIDVHK